MKITYFNDELLSRIWITGPFWQIKKARMLADKVLSQVTVCHWESIGLTFQITLDGKASHIMRAYKILMKNQNGLSA